MRRATNGAVALSMALSALAIAVCSTPSGAPSGAPSMGAPSGANKPTASTPPMGWNSWATFVSAAHSSLLRRRSSLLIFARAAAQGCAVNETILTDAANQMHALGLGPAGYLYVNTDDCELQATRRGRVAEGE